MSRCYPFPPPGYEKKTRTEDIDLLKKEKNREKKHKKEKRDKEKKDGKEKREKDRSDEKQKEKKEKKEKHRDKKKDKDKVRDKDKNNHVILEEKNFPGNAEAEKVEQNYEKSKEREKEKSTVLGEKVMGISAVCNGVVLGKNNHLASERKNYKQLHELGSKNGTGEVGMTHNRVEGMARQVEKNADRIEGMARQVETNVVRRMEVKEKIKGIEGDGKKGEKRKDEDSEKSIEKYKDKVKKIKLERSKDIGGEMLVEQSRIKDSNKVHADLLRVKDVNKKDSVVAQSDRPTKPVKEDIKAAASAAPEVLRKRKGFIPNGVLHVGDAGPNKVPRIASSSIPVTENGRRPFQNSTTFFSPVKQQALSNAKQDEADLGPNKMARITSSSLLVTENERSLQPSQESTVLTPIKQQALSNTPVKLQALSNTNLKQHTPSNTNLKQQAPSNTNLKQHAPSNTPVKQQAPSNTPVKQQAPNNTPVKQQALSNTPVKQQAQSKVKQNSKEHRINGTNKSPQSSARASQSTAPADRNSRAVKKLLPHPDTKYLTQVLSVPQMEEWSGFDEQEWLFRRSHSQLNKPKEEIARVDETIQQVWAEAVRIESADVYALPYVIPR